jgi:hypothetical protein
MQLIQERLRSLMLNSLAEDAAAYRILLDEPTGICDPICEGGSEIQPTNGTHADLDTTGDLPQRRVLMGLQRFELRGHSRAVRCGMCNARYSQLEQSAKIVFAHAMNVIPKNSS